MDNFIVSAFLIVNVGGMLLLVALCTFDEVRKV